MRIVVFVKQVPEVSELQLDPETRRLRRDGVDSMMNPFDRRAMLEARRLKDETGGTVTAITMGPPQAESILRECLAVGADRAVHLSDRGFAGADTLATARALARATEKLGFDLVLAGRYSIDSETGQVGPEVAALLGVPFLGGVRRLDVSVREEEATLDAECEGDDGFIEVDAPAPVVVTCTDRWKTRVPRVMPDDDAAAGTVEVWSVADLGGSPDDYGQAGSPTWVEEVQPVVSERRAVRRSHDEAGAVDELLRTFEEARAAAGASAPRPLRHPQRVDESPDVWVLGERGPDGHVRAVTWELLAAADELAAETGGATGLFLLEPTRADDAARLAPPDDRAEEVGRRGADVLYVSEAPVAATVDVLEAAIRVHRPKRVLAPATAVGRDLVPQVAARLGLGLTGDAIGVELDEAGRLQQLKPAFGGQVVAPILSRTSPEVVTLRPGVLECAASDAGRAPARVVRLGDPGAAPSRVRCRSFESEVGPEAAALEEAPVVVCVGFGLGEAGVEKARLLAARLGGVVAGTRRVCDLKWLPRQAQIGLSGRSVSPDLYVGFGVRGSFNHMVGLRRAKTVVAVNHDPEAEVFGVSDFGIVGDASAVLDELLERL